MVRNYKSSDLDSILQIWLDGNRRAHHFIPESYWEGNLDAVRDMMPQAELYVYEGDEGGIQGFIGLMEDYIAGIFVRWDVQSKGIGKQLLDDVKLRKHGLTLHVYQKNQRAVSFYRREGFQVKSEGIDDGTGEWEFLMVWKEQETETAEGGNLPWSETAEKRDMPQQCGGTDGKGAADMQIRTMTLEDYEEVYGLWMSCPGMGLNNLDDSREGIGHFLERNPRTCLVAVEENRIVGVILAGNDGRRGYIYHTAVALSSRGQGVGTRMVQETLRALKEEGIRKAALVVFDRNEGGNAFWEKQGFTEREDLVYRNKALAELVRIDT